MTPDAVLDAPFLSTVPPTTAVFIVLIAATLVLHMLFMHYALAGALLVAWSSLRGRSLGAAPGRLAAIVREWLPFAVSGAITAGIAPLLFVQVVYQGSFYTANLLLFNGWMAILPALILAMWLLYLSKAHHAARSRVAKATVATLAAGLIVFVGRAFVENHLVSLAPASWVAMYEGGASVSSLVIWTRLAMWIGMAFTTLASLVAWQVLGGACGSRMAERASLARPLSRLAVLGLIATAAAWWWHGHTSPGFVQSWLSPAARPWLACALTGATASVAAWGMMAVRGMITGRLVAMAVSATTLTLLGAAMVREVQRLAELAGTPSAARSVELGGGALVFAIAAVGGVAVIGWIVATVRRTPRTSISHCALGAERGVRRD
jgi:hypothetical protein